MPEHEPEPIGIRTEFLLKNPKALRGSAAQRCLCGGLLAEDDDARIWCLRCEQEPQ